MALATHQLRLSRGFFEEHQFDTQLLKNAERVNSFLYINTKLKIKQRFSKSWCVLSASSDDQILYGEMEQDVSEYEKYDLSNENLDISNSNTCLSGAAGKPGLLSFYNRSYESQEVIVAPSHEENENSPLWFVGPAVLVTSFVFPSLYLRRILSSIFEDSLLTDFLILFFTEALFYCGVAIFLFLVDRLWRPIKSVSATTNGRVTPRLFQRLSSVAVLVLSLIIPMVTMGLVWPWTGPAASATLAPYLVGIVVQFAFEQCARYKKSPSWPLIPVIFQVYRLHQLNRAAQLVTALSFTVRGAEMTSHNVAINSSLGTLLNVLQFLGVVCIWSLSGFVMRFFPSAGMNQIWDGKTDPC